ncbi:AsnC family transcriptional regulator [Nocardioides agariphilus]|uniref:AsnC family transcriptional regulator n=1 Tax=Nocardioides agariphilus TaxID=433664 RepID=A0A930VKS6_9ACTN|nr:winged helix-turn-helix transcriptional regulator [Nocardioides agariphilus]MBF4769354.1 AsnC family transcriptional regulator [Nocardioides agariphilus]
MDDSDREIVQLLRGDGRLSFVEIGRGVGMSPDAVRARLNRLVDEGMLRVLGIIDPSLLGYHVLATLALEYRGDSTAFASRLRESHAVTYLATALGEFNVICEVAATDDDDLSSRIQRIVSETSGIARAEVLRNVEIYKWEGSGARPRPAGGIAIDLDDLDVLLLRNLVDDPRTSYRDLAERVEHPYSQVRRRTIRLFESGAIQASAVVEPSVERLTIGLFCLELGRDAGATLKAIADEPEIKVLARTLGTYEATAEVTVSSPLALANLAGRLRTDFDVARISTLLLTHRPILPAQWRLGSVLKGQG